MAIKATADETKALDDLGEKIGLSKLATLFEKHAQVWTINTPASGTHSVVVDQTFFPDSTQVCDAVEMTAKIYDPDNPGLRRIRLQFSLKRAANENHQARVLDINYLKTSGNGSFALASVNSTLRTLDHKIMLPVSDSAPVQKFVALAQNHYAGQSFVIFDKSTRLTVK